MEVNKDMPSDLAFWARLWQETAASISALAAGLSGQMDLALAGARRDLREFWDAHAEWSYATFGSREYRGPQGPLDHLAKEVKEAEEAPDDPEEYADLMLLTMDAARRSGMSYADLMDACWAKLAKNKAREWPKSDPEKAVEHVREPRRPKR